MATIKDIAKMAGVSTSTVSHVVNQTRYVSPELVQRVEEAIQALDTPPNFVVKKNKSLLTRQHAERLFILLMFSDTGSPFQKQIQSAVNARLTDTPYTLFPVEYDPNDPKLSLIDTLFSRSDKIAGALVFPDDSQEVVHRFLGHVHFPVVMIGTSSGCSGFAFSGTDLTDGGFKAARHFIKNGHEQIAFIGIKGASCDMLLTGFLNAFSQLSENSEGPQIIILKNPDTELFASLDALTCAALPPSAIFIADDALLLPVLQYMNMHNITCPNDLSLIAFTQSPWAALHTPPVTAIEQDVDAIADQALHILLHSISEKNLPQDHTLQFPCTLQVRASTCGIGRGPFGEKAESVDKLKLTAQEKQLLRKQHYTAAISFHYGGKAWMDLHQKGIRDIFTDLGISLIAVTDAHFDPVLQTRQLASLEMLEPDILIAVPTDNAQTAPAFKRIASSKTRLVLITNVPDGLTPQDYVCCVSVNEHSHGQNMGRGIGEYMLRHGLTHLAFLTHGANFYATQQRDGAALQIIAEEYPQLCICDNVSFNAESEVYSKTADLLRRHPEIQALYTSWEGPAMEAMSALSDLGRTEIAIVTGDLDYDTALSMASKGMIKAISAQRPYEQGQAIALAAANALLHKKTPSFIGIEPLMVSPENLLKAWKEIFKEDAPSKIQEAMHAY